MINPHGRSELRQDMPMMKPAMMIMMMRVGGGRIGGERQKQATCQNGISLRGHIIHSVIGAG
jgi:hypothetical protein